MKRQSALPRPALELRPPAAEPEQPDAALRGPARVDIPGPLGLVHGSVPGFRASPARVRDGEGWRAVQVASGLAERMERAAGVKRGPFSDLTAAMHRRRWHEPRARLPARAQIAGNAAKHHVPFKAAREWARKIARDIPPSATARGKREIQSARGKMSGAARRAARYARDRAIVALLDRPGGTVRAVAHQSGESARAVATARVRLARTTSPDEKQWREGRKAARLAVKRWYRNHYRRCTDAGCACRDWQGRTPAPDARPWQFPQESNARIPARTRPKPQTDPRTLPLQA